MSHWVSQDRHNTPAARWEHRERVARFYCQRWLWAPKTIHCIGTKEPSLYTLQCNWNVWTAERRFLCPLKCSIVSRWQSSQFLCTNTITIMCFVKGTGWNHNWLHLASSTAIAGTQLIRELVGGGVITALTSQNITTCQPCWQVAGCSLKRFINYSFIPQSIHIL